MEPPRRRPRIVLAIPAVVYAALILLLSSRPGSDLPSVGVSDKFLHLIEYFLLGLLLLLPVGDFGWRHRLLALAVGIAFAALDEFLQTTVPSRLGDLGDLVADVGGLLAAVVFDATVRPWRFAARPS